MSRKEEPNSATQLLYDKINDAVDVRARRTQAIDGSRSFGSSQTAGSSPAGSAPDSDVYTQIDQVGGTGTPTYGAITGAINGSNKVFTVSAGYYISGTLMVWLNGVLQFQGTAANEWSETSPAAGTFTFGTAPPTGSGIHVSYGIGV